MESSSSQSVSHTPNWTNSGRGQSASSADPLAFFDLIMDSAKAMSAKGGAPLGPTPTATSPAAPSSENRSDSSPSGQWHDDRPTQSSAAYSPSEAPRSSRESESSHNDDPADDVAAVAELSSEAASEDDSAEQPDEAALETAAAAGQGEKLLAAPDPLKGNAEDATNPQVEEAIVADGKSTLQNDAAASTAIDTDAPLDTSAPASKGEGESSDEQASLNVAAQKKSTTDEEEAVPVETNEVAGEDVATETTTEVAPTHAERTDEVDEKSSENVGLESTSNSEATADQPPSPLDASNDRDDSSRGRHEAKAEDKPQVQPANDTSLTASNSASQTSTTTAESVAAASSATSAPSAGSASAPSNGTTNDTGVSNITSLLQRGMQRGTLQKSAEGKNTPQLDPKQQIRLINRVARAVESTPAGQSIKIRLNPSELGQLKVEIKIENGNMVARIEAENPATRQMLMQHLPQLRDRLAESNINIQQFDVDLMGQQSPQDGGATNLGDQQQGGESPSGSRQRTSQGAREEESIAPRSQQLNMEAERDSRNLNVTV